MNQTQAKKNVQYSQYDETLRRLQREDNVIWNPRSGDKIYGVAPMPTPNLYRKTSHLKGFASVAYHRMKNRSVGRKFGSKAEMGAWLLGLDDNAGKVTVSQPTGQYKTVWYSKGQRRQ